MQAARGRSRGKRAIAVLATTVLLIAVIEVAVLLLEKPHPGDRTNFLHLDFAAGEIVQRAIVYLKMRNLATEPTEVLQVGDSSGMHGVVPAVMQSKLGGARYLNMNVATTLGYIGYYTIAKYALENQKQPGTIKYLVLYTNLIGAIPRWQLWHDKKLIGFDLQREYGDAFHRLFQIPSLGVRQPVSRSLYYWNGTLMQPDAPITDNEGFDYFNHIHQMSRGWVRETDVPGDVPVDIWRIIRRDPNVPGPLVVVGVESFFDWQRLRRVTYMEHVYGRFAELAEKHGAKLIVVFNPVPEAVKNLYTLNPDINVLVEYEQITAELRRLRDLFPNVYLDTDFTYWPDDRFSVFSHVATPFAEESTERLANLLRKLMADQPNGGEGHGFPAEARIDLTRIFSGYGWEKDKQADGSVISWIGPRDVAAVWTGVEPGSAYTVRAHVAQAKGRARECLALVVNDHLAAPKSASGDGRVAWTVAADAVNRWGGWLRMSFTTRCALDVAKLWDADYPLSPGRTLAISEISVTPQ